MNFGRILKIRSVYTSKIIHRNINNVPSRLFRLLNRPIYRKTMDKCKKEAGEVMKKIQQIYSKKLTTFSIHSYFKRFNLREEKNWKHEVRVMDGRGRLFITKTPMAGKSCGGDDCSKKPSCDCPADCGKKKEDDKCGCDKKPDSCDKKDECKNVIPDKCKDDPCKKDTCPKKDPCKKDTCPKKCPCPKKDPCKKEACPKKVTCPKKEPPCKKKEEPCGKKENKCGKKVTPCKTPKGGCTKFTSLKSSPSNSQDFNIFDLVDIVDWEQVTDAENYYNDQYQNPTFNAFTTYAYYDMIEHLKEQRCPQPNAKNKPITLEEDDDDDEDCD